MKKLLFLLLLTVSAYGQTYQNPTYGTLTLKTSPTVNSHPYLTTTESNGVQSKVVSVMNQNANTGLLSGGVISVNTDTTKWDLAFGEGYVADPLNGTVSKISWGTQTALTTPYRTTSVATYVLMANAGGGFGTIVVQNTYPTPTQFRTHIYLGKLAHTTFTTILFAVPEPSRMYSVAGDLHDMVSTFGSLNRSGNAISPNGANLQINVSAGETLREGANYMNNRNSPNITTEPAVTATSFRNKFRNGSGGWNAVNTTTVDPNYYDNGSGILIAVPNNKFTVKVVYRFGGTGTIHMDYGQAIYDDLDSADRGIANVVAFDPDTKNFASRIGWIIIKQGTTSLLDATKYKFVPADKIGERAAGTSTPASLQSAYNNSVTPQIITNSTGGSVDFQNGTASDANPVTRVKNIVGSVTYSVTGAGNITGGTYNGYIPESNSNKATDFTTVNNTLYPTTQAVNNLIVNETTGNFSNIQTLINSNPDGTTINLKPNTIYIQQNGLTVKDRITINGNGATLKRDTEQTTTTTVSANQTSTSITVSGVPVGFAVGDRIQLYTDNTVNTSSQSVKITNISGNVLTLQNALTHSNLSTYTWAIGTIVRKVYHQINTPLDGSGTPIATVYTIKNLIIDGNYTNNTGNYYWSVNSAVFNNGKSLFEKCKFTNMPNENIIGHGFSVKNCYAENLNGSFIHQSANITLGEDIFGGEISGNTTKNTNIQPTPSVTGHSEGVICFSFSSGRISIHGNRFLGGGEAVLGVIASSINAIDGSNKNLIFNDNYAENFTKVVSSFNYFSSGFVTNVDNISISNNIFSNCGSNDWSSYASNIANFGIIKFTGNLLTNGTTVINIPEKMKDGFLLSGGTVDRIPKYNSLGYLTDGSLIDNGVILEATKPIFKSFSTQGNTVSPVYDKGIVGGITSTNESGIYFGNSFGNNNGTYLKFFTNPTGSASSPNNAIIINPSGVVDFESIPTAPTATAGTNTTQIATTAFVNTAIGGYKKYVALMSQSGTSAPTATVMENTLGGTVVWTRTGSGSYVGTLASTFTTNKTVIFVNNSDASFGYSVALNTGDNTIHWENGADGRMTNNGTMIEIRVYP